jgi:ribosomal protein S5
MEQWLVGEHVGKLRDASRVQECTAVVFVGDVDGSYGYGWG